MSVLVMAAVVVDIYDGSLTAGMSVLMMVAVVVDIHDGSVDTFDWLLQLCMNLAVVSAAAAAENTFIAAVAAAGNTLLVDIENTCLVVRRHASF
jgi:hypothetical protein